MSLLDRHAQDRIMPGLMDTGRKTTDGDRGMKATGRDNPSVSTRRSHATTAASTMDTVVTTGNEIAVIMNAARIRIRAFGGTVTMIATTAAVTIGRMIATETAINMGTETGIEDVSLSD